MEPGAMAAAGLQLDPGRAIRTAQGFQTTQDELGWEGTLWE